jgi:excisionase family DNA binding protein
LSVASIERLPPSVRPALPEQLITLGQMAEVFGVCTRTIHRWHDEGKIPEAIRVGRGRLLRWRWATVCSFLDKQEKRGGLGAR